MTRFVALPHLWLSRTDEEHVKRASTNCTRTPKTRRPNITIHLLWFPTKRPLLVPIPQLPVSTPAESFLFVPFSDRLVIVTTLSTPACLNLCSLCPMARVGERVP